MAAALDRAATLLDVLGRNLAEQGGAVAASCHAGEWTVAIHFGEEEPDSEMAAGAAYGTGPDLIDALTQALDETRWT